MPRKKHIVQTQKRRKAYSGGAMSADATAIKRKGAFRFFGNYTLFAIIGAIVLIGSIGATALFTSQNRNKSNTPSKTGMGFTTSTPDANSTAVPGATVVVGKRYTSAPAMAIDPNANYTATIKTEAGDVKIQLLAKEAPQAVNNFIFLAKDGFYNGSTFFRVIADATGTVQFVQAGDPTNTGTGNPGYQLPFERNSETFSGPVLAVARKDAAGEPNDGSQFFITLQNLPTYDGRFTVFGKVLSGADILSSLAPRDPQAMKDPPPGTAIQSIEISPS